MLRATLIDAAICIVAILAGLPWGVTGVAASIAVAGLLVRLPLAFWLATRRGPVSMGHILTAIAPAACAAIAAAPLPGRCSHRVCADTGPTVAACCWSVSAAWPPSDLPCSPGRRPARGPRLTCRSIRRAGALFELGAMGPRSVLARSETHGRGHRTDRGKERGARAESRFTTIAVIRFSSTSRASWRGADMRCGISFSPRTWGPRATRGGCRATPPISRSKRSRSAGRIPSKISFAGARRTSFMASSQAGGSRLLRPM